MDVSPFIEQTAFPCTLMRGGSSKGVFFQTKDVPPPGSARDCLIKAVMGTPDPAQIDGLGGAQLITSKVAIVAPSNQAGVDVDYTFGQVDIDKDAIDYAGNCGNISAAVGPYAIDQDWVVAHEPVTKVRILNTNTNKVLVAHVPVSQGRAKVGGSYVIAGVPRPGAEIFMDYSQTVGAKTGHMLPTGNVNDDLQLSDGSQLQFTVCDVANTVVFLHAHQLKLKGDEQPLHVNSDQILVQRLREIRGRIAERLGFVTDWRLADELSALLPCLMWVAKPTDSVQMNGANLLAGESDIAARFFFMNRLHSAMSGTGAMALAAASRIEGSVVQQNLLTQAGQTSQLRIAHPSGVMHVTADKLKIDRDGQRSIDRLGFSRTARKIMDGFVYVPTQWLKP